jgi:hypothetical protein
MRYAVAVLGVVLALVTAAPARADEQTFLDAVAALGYDNPADALSAGYAVCSMNKAVGLSLTERILRRILNKMDAAVDANNASPFAEAATANLCPRFG